MSGAHTDWKGEQGPEVDEEAEVDEPSSEIGSRRGKDTRSDPYSVDALAERARRPPSLLESLERSEDPLEGLGDSKGGLVDWDARSDSRRVLNVELARSKQASARVKSMDDAIVCEVEVMQMGAPKARARRRSVEPLIW